MKINDGILTFFCPGCETTHSVSVEPTDPCHWTWNGSLEKPTLSPSILTRSGHYVEGSHGCWCNYYTTHPEEEVVFKCYRCHSFIRDGNIEFLSDCSHKLAGKTVELPAYPIR